MVDDHNQKRGYNNAGSTFRRGDRSVAAAGDFDIHTMQDRIWEMMEKNPEIRERACDTIPIQNQHYLRDKAAFCDGNFGRGTEAALRAMQEFLNEKGFGPIAADGVYGDQTRGAMSGYIAAQKEARARGETPVAQQNKEPAGPAVPADYASLVPKGLKIPGATIIPDYSAPIDGTYVDRQNAFSSHNTTLSQAPTPPSYTMEMLLNRTAAPLRGAPVSDCNQNPQLASAGSGFDMSQHEGKRR